MKVVAMISGGKDSCYNMMQCVAAGHKIVALANLQPAENTDELDSYMYQTVGHQAINLYAEAMGLPLYRRVIEGSSLNIGREYQQCDGDEVEDLYHLLKQVKEVEGVEAVSVGAIMSDYQRVRVENVCARLHLQPLAYLWRRDQEELLREIISNCLSAIIIKVAAFGLDPEKHLGKSLAEIEPYLKQLSQKYGVNVCGEGGEYETFTLDCPLFKKKIVIDSMETVIHSADAFAPVGFLHFSKMHAEDKVNDPAGLGDLQHCPCQNSIDKLSDGMEHADETEDTQHSFTSISESSNAVRFCHQECGPIVQSSDRTTLGYQWICNISGSHCEGLNVQDQINQAFSLLQGELRKHGCSLEDIVLIHLYLKSMADFAAVNSVYQCFFDHNPPARVCVETLLPRGQLVQMDCLLHHSVGPALIGNSESKHFLHVQSLSHWAPANIGPYSQAVKVDEAVFCAGQIALVPCRMQLVDGGLSLQALLTLDHVVKILEATDNSLSLRHVLQVHCYVTHKSYIPAVRGIWERKLKESHTMEESYGEEEKQTALFVVVVVPCLPRQAAVELHVIAASDQPRERIFHQVTVELLVGHIECRVLQSSTQQCATISLSLSMCSDPVVQSQELVQKLCKTFHNVLQKMDRRLSPICGRAFYKHDSTLGRIYAEGLSELIKSCLDQRSSAVTLVPVQYLPDSEILHLSCWLSW